MIYRRFAPAVLALAFAAALTGCSGAVKMVVTPEPEPLPTLHGTWQRTNRWVEDGQPGYDIKTLTFVGNRYVEDNAEYDADTDTLLSDWNTQGGWSATDTMITVERADDHDDDPETVLQYIEIQKAYYWGDAKRNSLFVHAWSADEQAYGFERYERIPPLTVESLYGVWIRRDESGYNSVTINPDGSFVLEIRVEEDDAFRLTGTGEIDIENYVINLTGMERTFVDIDGNITRGPEQWVDGTGKAAFAPSAIGLLVSAPFYENDPSYPYGNYSMRLTMREDDR